MLTACEQQKALCAVFFHQLLVSLFHGSGILPVFCTNKPFATSKPAEVDSTNGCLQVLPKEIGGSAELVLIQDVPFSGSVQSADANGAAVKTQSAETNGSKSAQQEVAENGVLWENFCMLCHA